MNIPTNAEAIDPTAPIKAVKKNIIWLSLASLTSTNIILSLNSAGYSILIPPFDFLPTNSAFTFCFSFIFMHHGNFFISALLICLALLVVRSFFDFIFFEKHSDKFTKETRRTFSFLVDLKNELDRVLGPLPSKQSPLLYFIYIPSKTPPALSPISTKFQMLTSANFINNKELKETCKKLAMELPDTRLGNEYMTQELKHKLRNIYPPLAFEASSLRKEAYAEFYHYWIKYISCLTSPSFGLLTIVYCSYRLATM